MSIDEILAILENRLLTLGEGRKQAVQDGNLNQVVAIDADILSTQLSILQLKTPQSN